MFKASICTTVKNRSRVQVADRELHLFPNCVRSIVESGAHELNCELVVTDWQSSDWPLREWIYDMVGPLPVTLATLRGSFSRGGGRNQAAKLAGGELLFFLDADCLVCRPLLERVLEFGRHDKAYFPVVFSYNGADQQDGRWRHKGYGNCVVTRRLFTQVGGFPEYEFWGQEDVHFYESVKGVASVVREEVGGFVHQWHPNDFHWKNRYGVSSPFQEAKEKEKQQIALAVDELTRLLTADDVLILIDGACLEPHLPSTTRVTPFLERNGQYWGLPADSAQAVYELERLRAAGASLLAFAWPAFWWFEHYSEFHEYVSDRYRRLIASDRLMIFDLGDPSRGRRTDSAAWNEVMQ